MESSSRFYPMKHQNLRISALFIQYFESGIETAQEENWGELTVLCFTTKVISNYNYKEPCINPTPWESDLRTIPWMAYRYEHHTGERRVVYNDN